MALYEQEKDVSYERGIQIIKLQDALSLIHKTTCLEDAKRAAIEALKAVPAPYPFSQEQSS